MSSCVRVYVCPSIFVRVTISREQLFDFVSLTQSVVSRIGVRACHFSKLEHCEYMVATR